MQRLGKERLDEMKKRLRSEIFERLWNSVSISDFNKDAVQESFIRDIIKAITLLKRAEGVKGIQAFTDILSPLSIVSEGLFYENINDKFIAHECLQRLSKAVTSFFKDYESRDDRYEGALNISDIRDRLSNIVVIMDGLRYDLWLILKEIMIEGGWKIKDRPYRIAPPSTTEAFRELLGITEETGSINGKTYSVLKVAERDVGKRNLRKYIKEASSETGHIKFLHFNFIDTKVHGSTLDLYPLYNILKKEFVTGIMPILKELGSFQLISDHGFNDTKELKDRYRHGGRSLWEVILPFVEVKI